MESGNFLLVGASSGIGAALKSALEKAGHRVYTMGRNPMESAGHLEFDASQSALPALPSDWPEVFHGLAYMPGTIQLKPFHRSTMEDFQRDFQVNVLGFVQVLQMLLPSLKKAQSSSIVAFSTVAANTGLGFHASISASKGGLQSLCLSLASELAPAGIRVNCIAPSITNTPLAASLLNTEEKKEASARRHPLGRIGKPEDAASAAAFLLSSESSWITGQVLGLDGGFSRLK
jgi:NAD(P)-dependent dehydrogenase (short-subunit alcohol dehydrogenase family)